jgi:hypothetical protein
VRWLDSVGARIVSGGDSGSQQPGAPGGKATQARQDRTWADARLCWFRASGPGPGDAFDALDETTFVYDLVRGALEDVRADAGLAKERARDLIDNGGPARARIAARAVDQWLADVVSAVVRGGWIPSDLGEIVRRRLSAGHLPVLAAALAHEVAKHRADRVSPRWREDLEGLGQGTAANSRTTEGLALTLGLTAALSMLPRVTEVLPPQGRHRPVGTPG